MYVSAHPFPSIWLNLKKYMDLSLHNYTNIYYSTKLFNNLNSLYFLHYFSKCKYLISYIDFYVIIVTDYLI